MSRDQGPRLWVVCRLGAMGDVLLLTGVLEFWRRERGLRFVILTRAAWTGLFAGHPAVDRVVGVEEADLRPAAFMALGRSLAREYSGAGLLDLHGVIRSRLLGAVWPGRVRRYPKFSLERRLYLRFRRAFLRRRLERLNTPQRYALALERTPPPTGALAPRLWLAEEELLAAAGRLERASLTRAPVVALHPFATHPAKAWPWERWQELLQLLDAAGWAWYFLGRGALPQGMRETSSGGQGFLNRLSPRESAALLARSQALVSGDSGPMHLAGAVGTPLLALFGPTTRAWGFMPQGSGVRVLEKQLPCRPCSLHGKRICTRGLECLERIGAHEVMDDLRDVLQLQGERG